MFSKYRFRFTNNTFGIICCVSAAFLIISCDSEKRDYKNAVAQNNFGAYESFLSKYPGGKFGPKVQFAIFKMKWDTAQAGMIFLCGAKSVEVNGKTYNNSSSTYINATGGISGSYDLIGKQGSIFIESRMIDGSISKRYFVNISSDTGKLKKYLDELN
jgi:hypothetical protein